MQVYITNMPFLYNPQPSNHPAQLYTQHSCLALGTIHLALEGELGLAV